MGHLPVVSRLLANESIDGEGGAGYTGYDNGNGNGG